MANLIAGRRVVPELIQDEFTAANVVRALEPLLVDGPVRDEVMAGLREVRERLAPHDGAGNDADETAIERAAHICVELLARGNGATASETGTPKTGSSNGGSSIRRGEPEASALPAGTYQA
jgi:lipid-A-disaccharide synthase